MKSRCRFVRRREQVIISTDDDPVAEFTLMTFKGIKECFDGHQLSRMNLCQCEVFLFSELLIWNCEALDMLLATIIYIMSLLTTLGADVFVLLHLLCNCRHTGCYSHNNKHDKLREVCGLSPPSWKGETCTNWYSCKCVYVAPDW